MKEGIEELVKKLKGLRSYRIEDDAIYFVKEIGPEPFTDFRRSVLKNLMKKIEERNKRIKLNVIRIDVSAHDEPLPRYEWYVSGRILLSENLEKDINEILEVERKYVDGYSRFIRELVKREEMSIEEAYAFFGL